MASKKDLERETESLRDRLTSCQRALDAARDELAQKESRLSSLSREVRETEHSFHSNKTQYNLFKEQIASLLCEAFHKVEPYEEAIRERILALQDGNKEKAAVSITQMASHGHKPLALNSHGLYCIPVFDTAELSSWSCPM